MELKTKNKWGPFLAGVLRTIFERSISSLAKSQSRRSLYDDVIERTDPKQHVILINPPSISNGMLAIRNGAESIPLRDVDSVVYWLSPRVEGEVDMIVTRCDENKDLVHVYAGSFKGDDGVLTETKRLFDNLGIGNTRLLIPRGIVARRDTPEPPIT